MYSYQEIKKKLTADPKVWLVTGVAGFIGSNILEQLLLLNQTVIGIDNLSSGTNDNLLDVKSNVLTEQWARFKFYKLDVTVQESLNTIFKNNIDFVLHQAAISSVPYSLQYPEKVKNNNINGLLNILGLSKSFGIKAVVYASSSSIYGDNADEFKSEDSVGKVLSPYAESKAINEHDAIESTVQNGLNTIGLRYFNVYGKRQDPNGAYAGVIPKWLDRIINGKDIYINGDGSTTRDFCSVADVVRANILACFNVNVDSEHKIFNIGSGEAISLQQLYVLIVTQITNLGYCYELSPEYRDFIDGDIRHSCANIKLSKINLNFSISHNLEHGISELINWYINKHEKCLPAKL